MSTEAEATPVHSKREVVQAMWGLMLGMFVAILAGTVVSNALRLRAFATGSDHATATPRGSLATS